MFLSQKPKDQCRMRRFFLLFGWWAYVPVMIGNFVAKAILATAFVMVGARDIPFRLFRHPYIWANAMYSTVGTSRWFVDKHGRKRLESANSPLGYLIVFWNPFSVTAMTVIMLQLHWWGLNSGVAAYSAVWGIPTLFIVGHVVGWVMLLLLHKFILEDDKTWEQYAVQRKVERQTRSERAEKIAAEQRQVDFSQALAGLDRPITQRSEFRVRDLPRQNRTVGLYYDEVKRRVCRPFAK